ncbi:transporter substrate-binding domain-containing protein [Candidatus Harpocratesius sp.]
MKYKKILLLSIFMGLVILPTINVSASPNPVIEDTSLQDILDAGKIVVAMDAAYPPFENMINDTIQGFDVEIMEYIADRLNVTLELKDVAWDTIFTGLSTGTYDCICSAVTITPERQETMDFTRWYYKSTQAVMVSMKNPKNITSVETIDQDGVKIGFQIGTTSQWYLEDETSKCELNSYDTITLAMQALKQGAVHAVLGDYATLYSGKLSNPDTFAIIDTFSPEDFGIVFPKNSTAVVTLLNEYINDLLGEDQENPVFSQYYIDAHKKWMNDAEPTTDFVVDEVPEPQVSKITGYPSFGIIGIISVISAIIIFKNKKLRK